MSKMSSLIDEVFFNLHVRGCQLADEESNSACSAIKESYKQRLLAERTDELEAIGNKLMNKTVGVGYVTDREIESTLLSALDRKHAEVD